MKKLLHSTTKMGIIVGNFKDLAEVEFMGGGSGTFNKNRFSGKFHVGQNVKLICHYYSDNTVTHGFIPIETVTDPKTRDRIISKLDF